MSEISQDELNSISEELGSKLQSAIEDAGLHGYEIERLDLKPKADTTTKGLIPSCHLDCSVGGFPPKISCSLKCG